MRRMMNSIMFNSVMFLFIYLSLNCLAFSRGNMVMSSGIERQSTASSHGEYSATSSFNTQIALNNIQPEAITRRKKLNIIEKLSFNWVREVMVLGNKRPLGIKDLWNVDTNQVGNSSSVFSEYFSREKINSENYTSSVQSNNILAEFWRSPVTKAIVKMNSKQFLYTGILKFFNSLVQFTPALLISKLLKLAENSSSSRSPKSTQLGMIYACLLLLSLSAKALIENQYFDEVINMASSVKSTLSAAIYSKSLQLTPGSRQNNTVGELINYMQLDTARLEYVAGFIHTVWDGVLQVVGYTALLLHCLGPSVFAGIAALIVIIPLNAYFFDKLSFIKSELSKKTDGRVRLTNELLQGIRAIKAYNWETPYISLLNKIRKDELSSLKQSANTRAILVAILSSAPSFVAVLTLGLYTFLGHKLTPTKVFTSLALFNQLRFPLIFFPMLLNSLAEGKISLTRLTNFLLSPEIESYVDRNRDGLDTVSIKCSTFSWKQNLLPNAVFEPARGNLRNIDLSVKKGELVAIVGPVGSGKSSLISAILGDMYKQPNPESRVSVVGEVAYVPQTAWIPNDSLRNVILFGRPLHQAKYRQALKVCNLGRDLELLDSGDLTEIGERGANLSGGQKQRLSIARAVYEDADVYLLDDPLSALDAEVGSKLFSECIKGALQGKTRILVTHQLSVLSQVDRVIIMQQTNSGECTIADQGTLPELIRKGYDLTKLVEKDATSLQSEQSTDEITKPNNKNLLTDSAAHVSSVLVPSVSESNNIDHLEASTVIALTGNQIPASEILNHNTEQPSDDVDIHVAERQDGRSPIASQSLEDRLKASENLIQKSPKRLMTLEEKGEGAVSIDVYLTYLNAAKSPVLIGIVLGSFLLSNACQISQQWAVAAWTSDALYLKRSLPFYLTSVTALASGVAFFTWLRAYLGTVIGASSSQALHNDMVTSVLRAPLSFFESTPVGRLVQRFSKDMDQMDQQLPSSFAQLVASALNIAGALVTVTLATPTFGAIMIPILAVYFGITNFFRTVARELKRLDSISRSPIYQQFGETLAGLQVIRAFKRQKLFQRKNEVLLEDNVSAFFALKAVDRWLSVRLELLGNAIVFCAAFLAVWTQSKGGPAGISLSNALSITTMLNWAVRNGAETESYMNSVERILYTTRFTPSERHTVPKNGAPNIANLVATTGYDFAENNYPQTPSTGIIMTEPENFNTNEFVIDPTSVTDNDLISSGWPWQGGITFQDVHMRYRDDFDPVLNGISVRINPGECVGIVGRTGSGKSTLFRVLLRLSEIEQGAILIDGVDISRIGLDTLRSRISIIPQDAVLFSGSIRMNLDPFGDHDDESLWTALRKSHAADMIASLPGGLDFEVSEGGENFSAGQRQLLCLARAMVRKSKILILDEATSSVDYETDKLIQQTIREEFGRGQCTVLTIAHRLDSIIDSDRIMVMSAGRVGEFDAPKTLLNNSASLFKQLVDSDRRGHETPFTDYKSNTRSTKVDNNSSSKGESMKVTRTA